MIVWDSTHADDCPVTKERTNLVRLLDSDPENVYLLGAVPEYMADGDQEVELCDCGTVDVRGLAVA